MKNILITGGAGFVGANTAAYYLKKGKKVTIFDNFYRKGVKKNITWLKENYPKNNLTVIEGDIKNFSQIKKAVKKQDAIFHLAGQTAVTVSINNPRADFEANALGTFNVLEAVREINPKAIVLYSSTNKVYGVMGRVNTGKRGKRYYSIESPHIGESEILDFYSPYGCSKGAGDQYTHDYARIFGLKTIVFRQSCIYGAHQFGVEDQGWVSHFTNKAIKGETITIFGNGKQVRDMLYIQDLVEAFDKAIKRTSVTSGEVYNIGGGVDNTMSLLELIEYLQDLTGKKIKLKYSPARPGDQKVYISDISKAKRDFNWKPKIGVEEGVKLLYFWLKESQN